MIKKIYHILSSRALLVWLIIAWLLYYISSAIWLEEAFATFVKGVETSPLIQIPFVLLLVCGYLNIIRAFNDTYRKGRIGFIAWLMLSVGALLYLTGFFLSMNIRQFDSRLTGEGDMLRLPWSNETYRVTRIDPGLRDRVTAMDSAGVLAYEPKLTLTDSTGTSHVIGAYPPKKVRDTYFHILNSGLAPGVRLYRNSMLIDEGYMALRLLPPGTSAYFEIPPYPYRFVVNLMSDSMTHEEHHPVAAYNLKAPRYYTRVFEGDKIIAEGSVLDGINFSDFTLRYFEPTFWVLLESAKDAGIPVMRYGIFLFVFGIPVYLVKLIVASFRMSS